jgi:DNA-binding CsgD family transcriptional regulator
MPDGSLRRRLMTPLQRLSAWEHEVARILADNHQSIDHSELKYVYDKLRRVDGPLAVLTFREFEVLREICKGASRVSGAKLLKIGLKTWDVHRARMTRKLNLKTQFDIFSLGKKLNLF